MGNFSKFRSKNLKANLLSFTCSLFSDKHNLIVKEWLSQKNTFGSRRVVGLLKSCMCLQRFVVNRIKRRPVGKTDRLAGKLY